MIVLSITPNGWLYKDRSTLRLREARRGGVGAGKVVTASVERTTFADLCEIITTEYQTMQRKSTRRLAWAIKHLADAFKGWRANGMARERDHHGQDQQLHRRPSEGRRS